MIAMADILEWRATHRWQTLSQVEQDLWLGLQHQAAVPRRIVTVFEAYMRATAAPISRAEYLDNLTAKIAHPGFLSDLQPLFASRTGLTRIFPSAAQPQPKSEGRAPARPKYQGLAGARPSDFGCGCAAL